MEYLEYAVLPFPSKLKWLWLKALLRLGKHEVWELFCPNILC